MPMAKTGAVLFIVTLLIAGLSSSKVFAVDVDEIAPRRAPSDVEGTPLSRSEITLRWKAPTPNTQKGDILGYKIFYMVTNSPEELKGTQKHEEEIEVVPASATTHMLVFLDMFTEYRIQILGFNFAGEGPRSAPIIVKTLQAPPGPPELLRFDNITAHSLKVCWDPPKEKNGEIIDYLVTYENTKENEKCNQVKQKVKGNSLLVRNLEEDATYTFTVRAQTMNYGPAITGNVTTEAQQ